MIRIYGEEMLAPSPNSKLEDHTLSAVLNCLFNTFATTLHNWGRSSVRNLRTRHARVTETHLWEIMSNRENYTIKRGNWFNAKDLNPTPIILVLDSLRQKSNFRHSCVIYPFYIPCLWFLYINRKPGGEMFFNGSSLLFLFSFSICLSFLGSSDFSTTDNVSYQPKANVFLQNHFWSLLFRAGNCPRPAWSRHTSASSRPFFDSKTDVPSVLRVWILILDLRTTRLAVQPICEHCRLRRDNEAQAVAEPRLRKQMKLDFISWLISVFIWSTDCYHLKHFS